jgi:hypothetical protein
MDVSGVHLNKLSDCTKYELSSPQVHHVETYGIHMVYIARSDRQRHMVYMPRGA